MHQHRGVINVKDKVLQQISFDPLFGCLYLQFSGNKIRKSREYTDFITIDFDDKGHLAGIEFVGVKRVLPRMNKIFIELAHVYNRPDLKKVPREIKEFKRKIAALT